MSDSKEQKGEGAPDERVTWIKSRTRAFYRHIKEDKFEKSFDSTDFAEKLSSFLDNANVRSMLVLGDTLTGNI